MSEAYQPISLWVFMAGMLTCVCMTTHRCPVLLSSASTSSLLPHMLGILSDLSLEWFYLLSHVLCKSNVSFPELSLLSSGWHSAFCSLGISAKGALSEKMLRLSWHGFHIWMTAGPPTVFWVRSWYLENAQEVKQWLLELTAEQRTSFSLLLLEKKIIPPEE